MRNTTISGNIGTAIAASGGTVQLDSVTLTDNEAPAITHSAGTLSVFLVNTIVAGNTPGTPRRRSTPPAVSTTWPASPPATRSSSRSPTTAAPTSTHLPSNFDEFSRSPAIDAGENTLVSAANDQRGTGFERIYPPTSGTIDIGAVEAQNTLPTVNAGIDDQFALQNDPPATFIDPMPCARS